LQMPEAFAADAVSLMDFQSQLFDFSRVDGLQRKVPATLLPNSCSLSMA